LSCKVYVAKKNVSNGEWRKGHVFRRAEFAVLLKALGLRRLSNRPNCARKSLSGGEQAGDEEEHLIRFAAAPSDLVRAKSNRSRLKNRVKARRFREAAQFRGVIGAAFVDNEACGNNADAIMGGKRSSEVRSRREQGFAQAPA
jgi:hypothetical protein